MAALSGSIQLLAKTDAYLTALGSPWIPLAGQPFIVTDLATFGFGDGVTAYTALPKIPLTLNLATLLMLGNSTGGNPFNSDNGENIVDINDTRVQLYHLFGLSLALITLENGDILQQIAGGNVYIKHELSGLRLLYDAINGHDFYGGVRINSETANRVPYLDSNKKITASSITNTELGYLSGLASSVQAQLDALTTGQFWKKAVRVATTVAGTLSTDFENGDTIDGVVLATNDRILIKDQAAGAENGIYVVNASGAPTRATDFDASADNIAGATVGVLEGTANAETKWTCSTNLPITVGSTSLTFVNAGGTAYTGTTNRITLTGNQFDISAVFEALLLKAANNLSDLANAATARTNLGLAIGTNVQAYSSVLAALVTLNATAFGSTAGTFTEGNDSRLSDSRYSKSVFKLNTGVSHTGTTAETLLFASDALPSFQALDFFRTYFNIGGTSSGGTKTFRIYLNNADILDGNQKLQATVQFTNINNGGNGFVRNINIQTLTNQLKTPPATSQFTDEISSGNVGQPVNTNSADLSSGTWYVLVTCQLNTTGDFAYLNQGYGQIIR